MPSNTTPAHARDIAPRERRARLVRHEVSSRTLLTVLLLAGAVWLLTRLWPIVLVIVGALVLVGTLEPAVALFERRRLRRKWAVAIVFFSLTLGVLLLGVAVLPPLWNQALAMVTDLPAVQGLLVEMLARSQVTAPLGEALGRLHPTRWLVGTAAASALDYSTSVGVVVGYAAASVILALYLVADRDRVRAGLYAVLPRHYHLRLARVLLNLEILVGGYMRGQLITSLAIAGFVFVLLTACRIPGALALAIFAGLTDVIPFVGGLLATGPAVLAAGSRSLLTAGIVLGALILYQEFESRILVPWLYGRALRLSSAVVLIALLVGGKLLGIVGALLALPVAAGLMMMIRELRVEMPGDDSDDSAVRQRDAREEQHYQALTTGAAPEAAAAVAAEFASETHEAETAADKISAASPAR